MYVFLDEENYKHIQIDSEKDGTFNSNLVLWLHNLRPSIKAIKISFVVISLLHTILDAVQLLCLQSTDKHTKERAFATQREQNQSWIGEFYWS